MNKKDLIDINENELPNVTLSDEQKNRIMTPLKSNIRRFNENNNLLKIDNSVENINIINEKLGSEKDDIVHGVKHAKVLRELAIQAIHKDCPINPDKILYENLFQIGSGMENKDSTLSVFFSVFYCYIFISKDLFVSYSFDNFYRLQNKRVITITDINSVGISNKNKDGLMLNRNNLIIDINYKSKTLVSTYYLVGSCDDNEKSIKDVEKLLLSLGIKQFNHKLITLGKLTIILWYLFWFIGLIFFLIRFLSILF